VVLSEAAEAGCEAGAVSRSGRCGESATRPSWVRDVVVVRWRGIVVGWRGVVVGGETAVVEVARRRGDGERVVV